MFFLKLISKLPNFKGKGTLFQFFKKIYLKRGEPIVVVKGQLGVFSVDLRSFEWEYFCNGTYDENEMSLILSELNINETFIDVGANIGFYTVAIANKIKESNGKGKVISFEPHPENFKRLKKNIELNNLSSYVDLHNIGLSDKDQTLNLVLREDFSVGSETGNASIEINSDYDHGFQKIKIKTKIFDDFIKSNYNNNKISFIKIDIEGHEDNFLKGAQEVIKSYSPKIVIEVNLAYYHAKGIDACHEISKLLPDYHFKNIASGSGSTSTSSISIDQANKSSQILSEIAINDINNIYCFTV